MIDEQGAIKLIRFLLEVKKRPQLFLSRKSITELRAIQTGFVAGYNNALERSLTDFHEAVKGSNIWMRFVDYLFDKYSSHIKSNYCHQLLCVCGSEESAFDLFFEELEDYLQANNIEIHES